MTTEFTDQQKKYIYSDKLEDSKLIACAGSGKTRCIIFKMDYLIKTKKVKSNEILMLTFSRFTRDDFLNKVKKCKISSIDEKCVKTIDSFAKNLIDENNEIDVSLLSYKFMKYLEDTPAEIIKKNTKLAPIITLFIDEAQDLNEIQFNILKLLKEKKGVFINLIGDPNQNIYQFRKSSDKYLMNFQATTFYLTKNFRSHDSVIEFSKYLRPNDDMVIEGKLGKNNCKPMIVFHENDLDLEAHIVHFLENAKKCGINFKDIAILAPTRGRMKGYGNSHGLCLVSNLLYKNKIKFKQFYEEATDEINNNIRYFPEDNTVNVLTYMGSKGLEWKFVLLADANICLINKRHFSEEKHENDRYLLYVASSRAIDNMIIFSRYRCHDGNMNFQLNPWFSKIPKSCYTMDKQYEKYFKFPQIKPHDMRENERKVTKIIDKFDEKTLDELAQICQYGSSNANKQKQITNIFEKECSSLSSSIFLGKYVENLFFALYRMQHKMEKRKYIDIENIINSEHIVMDIPVSVSEWYYANRDHLSWETFDVEKSGMDKIIVECVEKKFNRSRKLAEHTIVNDGYFKSFILSISNEIKSNYERYMKTKSKNIIRKCLFNISVIMYSLETQHYFHAISRGEKFKHILKDCKDMFSEMEKYVANMKIKILNTNVALSKWNLIGEVDLLEEKGNNQIIWEIKCVSDISLKHILQVLMYNIMFNYDKYQNNGNGEFFVEINFINFLKGEMINIKIPMNMEKIDKIKDIFVTYSSSVSLTPL